MIFQKKQKWKPQKPIHFIFHDYDNSPITEVWVSADRQTVNYKNYKYQNEPILQVFNGEPNPTWQGVLNFFERRSFSRQRSDIKDILKYCHLKEYDPEALVRFFKGRAEQDDCWIEFIEEDQYGKGKNKMIFQKKKKQKQPKPIHFIFRDYDNSPITEVWASADRQTVNYKNYKYQDEPMATVFGDRQSPTWDDVLHFFERRTFSRGRSDLNDILKDCHLKEYDPEALVRFFQGRAGQDDCWIDFIEED